MRSVQATQGSGPEPRRRVAARGGFSLVEVLVSVVVLTFGVLGLTSVGTATVRQLGTARGDLHLWAAMQTIGDSLQQSGYSTASAGSRTMDGYSLSWTVDKSTSNLARVTLAGKLPGRVAVADTVMLFLVNASAP
jgi:Tfp pilus assembly protein PilV